MGLLSPPAREMERMEEDVAIARYQLQVYQKRRDNMISNMNRRLMTRKGKLDPELHDPSGESSLFLCEGASPHEDRQNQSLRD